MINNFISLKYCSKRKVMAMLRLIRQVKTYPLRYKNKLKGKVVGLLFEKPSLRTKTSFYVGALQTGADAIYYAPSEIKLGQRESVHDVARTIARYIDCAVIRTFSHEVILDFVKASTIPVVNALSDLLHPSQALADLFTLYETKKDLKKIKCAYIGDGNNVCRSLMYAFSMVGGNLFVAAPGKYAPDKEILSEVKQFNKFSGGKVVITDNPYEAVKKADVIYTDVWASMGEEEQKEQKIKDFRMYQVNKQLVAAAEADCVIMHCLPAHRGEEITDEVVDSKNSIVFLQAENRMHAAKAILLCLLGGLK